MMTRHFNQTNSESEIDLIYRTLKWLVYLYLVVHNTRYLLLAKHDSAFSKLYFTR